jgi:prepilin-type N-terminal cleavage/methylation domain-containing protein
MKKNSLSKNLVLNYHKGFTLIELLVVTVIVVLLLSISVTAMTSYRNQGKDIKIISSLRQVRSIAEMIFSDKNSYINLCGLDNTLNDINPEHPSLKILEDSISSLTGEKPACFADTLHYCVQAKTFNSLNYCIDNTGVSVHNGDCSATNIKCSSL